MSYFSELNELSKQLSIKLNDELEEARYLAKNLLEEYSDYLDAPLNGLEFVELNQDLIKTGNISPINQLPRLVKNIDGFYFVRFNLKFETSNLEVELQLIKKEFLWGAKFYGKHFELRNGERSSFNELIKFMHAESKKVINGESGISQIGFYKVRGQQI